MLAGSGAPAPGARVSIETSAALGGTTGILFVGPRLGAPIPVVGGSISVSPVILLPSQLGGSPGVAGAGTGSFSATLPGNEALIGASVSFQAGYFDPSAVFSFSLTNGLEMVIG